MGYDWSTFKGLMPANLTPMRSDGSVNEEALRQSIEFVIKKGVDGIYANGLTGEAFLLSLEERKKTIEIIVKQTAGRIPIINQVGSINFQDSIELARHSRECGVEGISALTPFLYGPSNEEIEYYFNSLMEASGLPFFMFSYKPATGVDVTFDLAEKLARNPLCAGIKYSVENFPEMTRMKEINNGKFNVLSGLDTMCTAALGAGISSFIGGFYSVIPEMYRDIYDTFMAGKIEEANDILLLANDIIRTAFGYPVYAALKAMLEMRGIEGGACKKPYRSLTDEEKRSLRGELITVGKARKSKYAFFDELANA